MGSLEAGELYVVLLHSFLIPSCLIYIVGSLVSEIEYKEVDIEYVYLNGTEYIRKDLYCIEPETRPIVQEKYDMKTLCRTYSMCPRDFIGYAGTKEYKDRMIGRLKDELADDVIEYMTVETHEDAYGNTIYKAKINIGDRW